MNRRCHVSSARGRHLLHQLRSSRLDACQSVRVDCSLSEQKRGRRVNVCVCVYLGGGGQGVACRSSSSLSSRGVKMCLKLHIHSKNSSGTRDTSSFRIWSNRRSTSGTTHNRSRVHRWDHTPGRTGSHTHSRVHRRDQTPGQTGSPAPS